MDLPAASYFDRARLGRFVKREYLPHFKVRTYGSGERILECGFPVEALYFFVEGRVKVRIPAENGRDLLLCFYDPPQVFGDLELFQDERAAVTTVEAVTACTCLALPRDFIGSRLAEDGQFLQELCRSLGRKLGRVIRNSALNLLHPLDCRVASYILAVTPRPPEGPPAFSANLSQAADLLGTTFRHLHRTLAALCGTGVLRKEGRTYVIVDGEALRAKAAGAYTLG